MKKIAMIVAAMMMSAGAMAVEAAKPVEAVKTEVKAEATKAPEVKKEVAPVVKKEVAPVAKKEVKAEVKKEEVKAPVAPAPTK